MTIDAPTTARELTMLPVPGEIRFSINLALIDDVPALYGMIEHLGLKPQLVWLRTRAGVEIHLLLYQEVRDELLGHADLFEEEQLYLADRINPDAMRFTCGLTKSLSRAA